MGQGHERGFICTWPSWAIWSSGPFFYSQVGLFRMVLPGKQISVFSYRAGMMHSKAWSDGICMPERRQSENILQPEASLAFRKGHIPVSLSFGDHPSFNCLAGMLSKAPCSRTWYLPLSVSKPIKLMSSCCSGYRICLLLIVKKPCRVFKPFNR